jgi:hypothetical protein
VIENVYPYNVFVDESRQVRLGPAVYPAAFGVAAYVATFDRWLELEKRWREILHNFKVPLDGKPEHTEPVFHTTYFIARKRQFKNDWSDEKRDEFMELLTLTASEHTIAGVACCVDEKEYERVLLMTLKQGFESHISFAYGESYRHSAE